MHGEIDGFFDFNYNNVTKRFSLFISIFLNEHPLSLRSTELFKFFSDD